MIGRALGDARERAGLTQAAAAKKAGMPQSTLAEIETGRRPVRLSEALTLIDLYGTRLDALDVRDRDAGYAKIKRGRGRPRKNVEFKFSSDDDALRRVDTVFTKVRFQPDPGASADFDELLALMLYLLDRPRFARHAAAVKAVIGAARGWVDPTTDDLFDPLGLAGVARDLLTGRASPDRVVLR